MAPWKRPDVAIISIILLTIIILPVLVGSLDILRRRIWPLQRQEITISLAEKARGEPSPPESQKEAQLREDASPPESLQQADKSLATFIA